jgi:hypothetical protein
MIRSFRAKACLVQEILHARPTCDRLMQKNTYQAQRAALDYKADLSLQESGDSQGSKS